MLIRWMLGLCVCVPGGNISCKSSSKEVRIQIGINTLRLHQGPLDNLNVYTTNDVNNTCHLKTIECFARLDNNVDRWFRANRSLYIIVPPAELKMHFPMLKYGGLLNITCTAYRVRPPPKLQMILEGKTADDADQIDVLDDSSQLYTSSLVKQLHLDRRLSNTTAMCTSISITDYQKHTQVNSTSQILSFTYPPSHLKMTKPAKPDHAASWYQFYIGCRAFDSTEVCSIKWSTDKNCLNIHNTTESRPLFDVDSWISVNVSQNTMECQISCYVVCNESTVFLKEDFIVEIPDPPSHLEMTKPPKPDHVASWYQFYIGCKAFDSTDVCTIKWSTGNNCLNIHNTTESRQLFDFDSWIYVNVSQNTTECRISCYVVCNEYTVFMKEDFIVEIPGIGPVLSSISADPSPLILIISVSAPLLLLFCTVLSVYIGKKRNLCTQQQIPTGQHHYTSLWDRDGVHFARDLMEHVYNHSEIEPTLDDINQIEASEESTQNQLTESQLYTNLYENTGQSSSNHQIQPCDDNYDTISDVHDGLSE